MPRALARWTLPILLSSLGLGCESNTSKDLADFCRVATEIEKQGMLSAEEKIAKLESRRPEYERPMTIGSLDLWGKHKEYQGEDKYKWLVTVARKEGNSDWRCPPYVKLLTAETIARLAKEKPAEEPPAVAGPVAAADAAASVVVEKPPAEKAKKTKKAKRVKAKKKKKSQ